jgi:hypothetical protein
VVTTELIQGISSAPKDIPREKALMHAVNSLSRRYGRDTLQLGCARH